MLLLTQSHWEDPGSPKQSSAGISFEVLMWNGLTSEAVSSPTTAARHPDITIYEACCTPSNAGFYDVSETWA